MRLALCLAVLLLPAAASAAEPRLMAGQWHFTLSDLDGASRSVDSCIRSQADEHTALGLPDRGAAPKGCAVSEHRDADQLGGRMSCSGRPDLHYRISVGGSSTEGIIQTGKAKTIIKGLRGGECR